MDNSELEKVVRRAESLISCDKRECPVRGDYWKCYNGNEKHCNLYLDGYVTKVTLRHHNI